ncbi:hypothetical protein AVEN_265021-3 [Araneus ventricosus]|uniref:V-SNARE coiled-coil homology domain-containing protein n=1 Tax=Araneus ventricosus TaxID=182803 RepID=A0A4Y2EHF1_ARAVE|nr:hypothetical protein AVEN_265021-3 [Araneus ventricosus]
MRILLSVSLCNNKMSTEGNEALSPPTRQPNPQQSASSKRLQQTQAQVDEVVGIMRVNVEKVLERDQKLSELDDRAGEVLNELCKRINLVSAQFLKEIGFNG